jgi:pimeloyl-ACP methyl ester carboxylesterase
MREDFAADAFEIAVPDAALFDLQERLGRTRWPNVEPAGRPWTWGTDQRWLQGVAEHWRSRYDWRKWEARLNSVPNYHATLDGKRLHFMLERGSGPNPLPLILTHGWPGSVVEFLDVIQPLAHPERFGGDAADAFTVVVPSLPGYGFSEAPDAPIGPRDVAALWSRLMVDVLGCDKYVAQGGDWGGIVTGWLALEQTRNLAAAHMNNVPFSAHTDPADPFTAEEIAWLEANKVRRAGMSAYQEIQGTRPQSLAYGLTDSPIGLAGWILEKFHEWTNKHEDAPPPFDTDRLLTNVMVYWLTGINAANWMYASIFNGTARAETGFVETPCGFLLCPTDFSLPAPEKWVRRRHNVASYRVADKGGHFLAFEQPELFVQEVRRFFREYR